MCGKSDGAQHCEQIARPIDPSGPSRVIRPKPAVAVSIPSNSETNGLFL